MQVDWGQIAFTVLPILLGIGIVWTKISKVLTALVELSEVLTVINSSLQDKNLTKEEIEKIKQEIKEAIQAFKNIFKK